MTVPDDSINLDEIFLDSAEMKIDAKGRVGIPEKFVKVLRRICPDHADSIGVAPTPERSVRLMPYPFFMAQLADWRRRAGEKKSARTMLNVMTSLSALLPLDPQNRIRLNPAIMKLCNLERDVIIVGNIDTMQLFDQRTFESTIEASLDGFDAALEDEIRAQAPQAPVQYIINPVAKPEDKTESS